MATGEGCGIASFRKVIPTSEGLGASTQCQAAIFVQDKVEPRAPPSYGINAKPPSQCPELEAEKGNYEAGNVGAARFKKVIPRFEQSRSEPMTDGVASSTQPQWSNPQVCARLLSLSQVADSRQRREKRAWCQSLKVRATRD